MKHEFHRLNSCNLSDGLINVACELGSSNYFLPCEGLAQEYLQLCIENCYLEKVASLIVLSYEFFHVSFDQTWRNNQTLG